MNDNPDEVWKDINDWPYHQISNQGRIRLLPGGKISRWEIAEEIKIKEPARDKLSGYLYVSRRIGIRTYRHCIHCLVLTAFSGPCPPGLECRHLNGDPSDNRWPENLKWGTRKENAEDRVKHGTDLSGERNHQAKLAESQVLDIKSREGYWGINAHLAKEFGVDQSTIWLIRKGRKWQGVVS